MSIEEEIVKSLPTKDIYEDLAKPGTAQAGKFIEDLCKTLRLATAPIQLTAALQDKFQNFIERSVKRVPEERFVPPAPQIIGPVLEGVRYEPEGTPIHEMFSKLLSNSMDKDYVQLGHPAYPGIIRQLSSDEAIVLELLSTPPTFSRTLELDLKVIDGQRRFVNSRILHDDFPKDKLSLPARLNFYIDHLHAMGLAGLYRTQTKPIYSNNKQIASKETSEYRLTNLGSDFIAACQAKSRE